MRIKLDLDEQDFFTLDEIDEMIKHYEAIVADDAIESFKRVMKMHEGDVIDTGTSSLKKLAEIAAKMAIEAMDKGTMPMNEELYRKSKEVIEMTDGNPQTAFDAFMLYRKASQVTLNKLVILRSRLQSFVNGLG